MKNDSYIMQNSFEWQNWMIVNLLVDTVQKQRGFETMRRTEIEIGEEKPTRLNIKTILVKCIGKVSDERKGNKRKKKDTRLSEEKIQILRKRRCKKT